MKLLKHPTIGKWSQGKDGDYRQKLVIDGAKVAFILNCAYEGPDKTAHNLECCISIAERIYVISKNKSRRPGVSHLGGV